jgi:hypothetical protein
MIIDVGALSNTRRMVIELTGKKVEHLPNKTIW